ncbi:LysR family transcriptional regulator [Photobacterium alginatilyticum]|uniref:LysR family transcriptional regulator n=1 Tax=Photobacterium alginatilyticum TaxID=1775171 RepID=A0ABW9YNG9_9GAMM|nr:LysR family transcriptional regulator [Photobacterium alginatilyticum]NBI55422.1 LysR family transcriptional regulator [Photobacterium alginatilyticum]
MAQHLRRRLNTIRPLHVFQTVYEVGSITKAADMLNLTQPTISIQLRKLTEALGTPLYKQVGRKLVFTEAAEIVAAHSVELFETLDRLEISLADLNELKAGTLRIAVVTSAKYFIPHLLGSFCQQYPLVDIELTVGNRAKIIQRYAQDLDDIYLFSHLSDEMTKNAISFLVNPLVAIAHAQHPLAQKESILPEELCHYPYISREYGSGTRYAIEHFFEGRGLKLSPQMTIESNEAIKHCVIADLGVSILSEYAIRYEPTPHLVSLPVEGFPILTSWHLVRSAHRIQTVLSEAFVEFIQENGKNVMNQSL